MSKIRIVLAILIMASTVVQAQTKALSDIGNLRLRDLGEIYEGDKIRGYYYFYQSDKISSSEREYEVVVMDENLEEKSRNKIIENKRVYLLESVYNGNTILFKFYDYKEKEVIYWTVDNNGNMGERSTRVGEKLELATYNMNRQQNRENSSLFPVNDELFVDMRMTKLSKYTYEAILLDNKGRVKGNYIGSQEDKVSTGAFLTASDDQIVIIESLLSSLMSKEIKFNLVGLSLTGEKVFSKPFATTKYNLVPHNAVWDNEKQNYLLIGEYYNIEDKMAKSESQGIFTIRSDKKGKFSNELFLSWDKDLKPRMQGDESEDSDKFSLYFHDVVLTKNGTILAIGEQYLKRFSALGAAAMIAGGSNSDMSLAEMRIGDMALVEISPEGKVKDVTMYEKKNSTQYLPSGYEFVGQHVLGKLMKALGAYDFEFVQFNEDKSVATIGFYDREKEKGKVFKQLKFVLTSYVEAEGTYSTTKLDVEVNGDNNRIYRAKPGHIMIGDQDKKARTIILRLEPVNY